MKKLIALLIVGFAAFCAYKSIKATVEANKKAAEAPEDDVPADDGAEGPANEAEAPAENADGTEENTEEEKTEDEA